MDDFSLPPLTLDQLRACQFSSWYPTFRNLHKLSNPLKSNDDPSAPKIYKYNNVTIRSIIIKPLPKEFIAYLKCDGVKLPLGAENLSSFLPDINRDGTDDWSSGDEDEENNDDEAETSSEMRKNEYHFPELNEKINNALEKLGPSLPKLNWSSPKDVTWLNAETLKCCTVGDVYLLLKSSDFCMFDITHALDGVQQESINCACSGAHEQGTNQDSLIEYELVLRKWSNLHASMEFRCFVSKHNIVAISQRNHTQHFPHLKKDYMMIRSNILNFFLNTIQYTYAASKVENYVFDVYIDKNERVWLIDFNVWSKRTDSLLFEWDEIMHITNSIDETDNPGDVNDDRKDIVDLENKNPEIRVVMNENEVLTDPLSSYRAPMDTVDLASESMGLHSFQDFMAMCQPPSTMNDDSDDDSDDVRQ